MFRRWRKKLRLKQKRTKPNSDESLAFQIGFKAAQAAEKLGVGNCGELADVGKIYAWEKHPHQIVERAWTSSHVFLVIGRDKESDPSNYKTWGNACVICDVWKRTYFPASYAVEELDDYKGFVSIKKYGGEYRFPVVKPFNSQTEKLTCEVISLEIKQRVFANQRNILHKQKRNCFLAFFTRKRKNVKNMLAAGLMHLSEN